MTPDINKLCKAINNHDKNPDALTALLADLPHGGAETDA